MKNKRYATYRIGMNQHYPMSRTGNEIDETTDLSFEGFINETEENIGGPISLIWMGTIPMPDTELKKK